MNKFTLGCLAAFSFVFGATISQAQTVTSFTLVNSNTNADIRPLTEGGIVYLDEHVNIRANTSGTVQSVKFLLNSALFTTENEVPYALAGDHSGDYDEWMKSVGNYTLTAIPYPQDEAMGTAGTSLTIHFSVVRRPDITFTLVNADTDADIGPLVNGQTVNLATIGTTHIAIRANSTFSGTESVKFDFTGTAHDRIENEPPYALFTDNNGNYLAWSDPNPGTYTLNAVPYTGNLATGTAGVGNTISFTIVNPMMRTGNLETFPNPSENEVAVDLSDINAATADVTITDMSGKTYFSGKAQTGGQFRIDLSGLNMSTGIYLVKVNTGTETRVGRIFKK